MKDHPVFLEAAALLANKREDTRFVCVGDGPDDYRAQLQAQAKRLGLDKRLLWVAAPKDMPAVYNALDIHVSSSCGEGLSNVICEAMACGVRCVVTDVGDSAWVVGDQGEVIPPKNPRALMEAIKSVLDGKRYDSAHIRKRVVSQLSVNSLVTATEDVLSALLRDSTPRLFGWRRARPVS
jgi:glycosyltransferase involved in cell wall biosynthesis